MLPVLAGYITQFTLLLCVWVVLPVSASASASAAGTCSGPGGKYTNSNNFKIGVIPV